MYLTGKRNQKQEEIKMNDIMKLWEEKDELVDIIRRNGKATEEQEARLSFLLHEISAYEDEQDFWDDKYSSEW